MRDPKAFSILEQIATKFNLSVSGLYDSSDNVPLHLNIYKGQVTRNEYAFIDHG
jgi:hypothetical protein